MSQPGPRQTKKQKKALAFRTRQKTSKKKNKDLDDDDEDALGFPIDENQDLAGLAGLPLEAEEISAKDGSGGRKGKAEGGGQRQHQPNGSKKRKREGEEVVEEKPLKKSKAQPTVTLESGVEDDDDQKTVEVKKKVQPQRFILFIGAFRAYLASGGGLTGDDCRQFEVLYNKGCYPFSFLLLRYAILKARVPHHSFARVRSTTHCPITYT